MAKKTEDARAMISAYLGNNVVADFSDIPTSIRLSFLQETPQQFIKTRSIGNTQIPYIDHYYAERCLNFISNFNWGSEMIRSEIIETTKGGKKVFEALVEMKMWIFIDDKKIERYVASGHTMYDNPAVTRADALQSAISKANTKFVRQFGVGAQIIQGETKAYERIEKFYVDGEEADKIKLTDKEFQEIIRNSVEWIVRHQDDYNFTPEQQVVIDGIIEKGIGGAK